MNPNEPGPKSLADVARAAQVSVSTVSLVLRDMGTISLKTRNHVRKVAQELGYRPNLAASLLARHHNHILPSIPVALIGMGVKRSYPFASIPFVTSFSRYATQLGFQVIEPDAADCTHLPSMLRILYARGVRGLIVNHSFDAGQMTDEEASNFSFLFYGQSLSDHRFHHVATEVFESTRMLWETAWKRGYRRIGVMLCRHKQNLQDDFARESAVLGCESRYNAQPIPSFFGGHWDMEGVVEWTKKVRPDVIIGFHGGIMPLLRQAGFRIPEDIALCALHLHETETDVTGFYQDFDELAQVAAHQMEATISRNETGFPTRPRALLVSPVFREGKTLPLRTAHDLSPAHSL